MVHNLQHFAFWNLIIRPPRAKYTKEVLGPADFTFEGGRGKRRDVELQTSRGSLVQCSHFVPVGRGLNQIPVVVYLHGNASNRLEAWDVVVPFLKRSVSVFCYDAAGCGISEGDYISCGWHESRDLEDIVKHLRKSPFCGPIAMWGWSMGAVTALLYASSCDDAVTALCLESPFSSLESVCKDLAMSGSQIAVKLPSWLVEPVYALVKMQVQNLAFFDIDEVVPLDSARKAQVPAIFITRKNDSFIQPHHIAEILAVYAGDCEHMELDGDHSCSRTPEDIQKIVDFFCRSFIPFALASGMSKEIYNEFAIPEEHLREQPHPTPRKSLPDSLPYISDDFGSVPWEPARSMPKFWETGGLDFPEPRLLSRILGDDEPTSQQESDGQQESLAPVRVSRSMGVTAVPKS